MKQIFKKIIKNLFKDILLVFVLILVAGIGGGVYMKINNIDIVYAAHDDEMSGSKRTEAIRKKQEENKERAEKQKEEKMDKLNKEIEELENQLENENLSEKQYEEIENKLRKKQVELERLENNLPNEDDWIGNLLYFIGHFFEELIKAVICAILVGIAMIIYIISKLLYSIFGNDFMSSFIGYSLNFESLGGAVTSVSSTVSSLISSLAFSLIVLFVLKNILLNYILWRGNPNENPLEVIIGIAMTIAMMAGFNDIYSLISNSLGSIIKSINGGSVNFAEIPDIIVNSLNQNAPKITEKSNFTKIVNSFLSYVNGDIQKAIMLIIALLISIILFKHFIQAMISAMKSGFELLALKIGAPLACLSLLNNNIGGFSSYIKEIIKRFFGIMIKVAAISICLGLFASVNSFSKLVIYSCAILACIGIIENPSQILAGIATGAGSGNELSSASNSGGEIAKAAKAMGNPASKVGGGIKNFINNAGAGMKPFQW